MEYRLGVHERQQRFHPEVELHENLVALKNLVLPRPPPMPAYPQHRLRLQHEFFNVELPLHVKEADPVSMEAGSVAEERVVDRIGYICMVALCILFIFI
jgi:hypothetical protein